MKTFFTLLLATLCAATSYGQTMKALSYNASNGVVAYSSTNTLQLPASVKFGGDAGINSSVLQFANEDRISLEETRFVGDWTFGGGITFEAAASVRTNLGAQATLISGTNIKTINGQPILGAGDLVISGGTNTNSFNQSLNTTDDVSFNALNVSNKAATRTNLGLGGENSWKLSSEILLSNNIFYFGTNAAWALEDNAMYVPISFENGSAGGTRTNLGLGATNIVTFAGLTNNGDININSTTASNGLLYIRRTNNEPFLGMANLLASNNTTISNETLFRVGVAEATNRSAQFGFRSTNTNGSGVAVFSVFGFNALMQIGADASTNAVIYSGGGTNNEVMTLIRDGATEFARPIRFSTNASTRPATNAPANTTNVAAWVEFRIGTNSYRAPLYQ
jgi:hypothetical protein